MQKASEVWGEARGHEQHSISAGSTAVQCWHVGTTAATTHRAAASNPHLSLQETKSLFFFILPYAQFVLRMESAGFAWWQALWRASLVLQQSQRTRKVPKMHVKITPRRNSVVCLCYCVPLNLSPLKLWVQCQIINIIKACKIQS